MVIGKDAGCLECWNGWVGVFLSGWVFFIKNDDDDQNVKQADE